jgi:hypothetical protein
MRERTGEWTCFPLCGYRLEIRVLIRCSSKTVGSARLRGGPKTLARTKRPTKAEFVSIPQHLLRSLPYRHACLLFVDHWALW